MPLENIPCGCLKLEGEDGVIRVAYLTNVATLGAKVAAEHVIRSMLHQPAQKVYILALCYLTKKKLKKIQMPICRYFKVADPICNRSGPEGYLSQVLDTVQVV